MKTMSNFFKMGMLVLALVSTSCSKDGADGATGPAGSQGVAGTDGTNGTDGTDGIDGNANVQAFTYDISAVAASSHVQSIPELTQDVIDNDVILGYVTHQSGYQYPIPAVRVFGAFDALTAYKTSTYEIYFFNSSTGAAYNLTTGELVELKVIIIESSSTTAAKMGKQNILSDLKAAGVDVGKYDEVMAYYGLD